MSRRALSLSLLLLIASSAWAQKKQSKDTFPALILHARYVYVTAMTGDAYAPTGRVSREDRAAVFQVENGIREWRRYALTTRPEDADIIVALRRGNIASTRGGVRIGTGSDGTQLGQVAGFDAGSPDDTLMVLDGHVSDPLQSRALWRRSQAHGLDSPALPLFQQFKKDTESAAARHP